MASKISHKLSPGLKKKARLLQLAGDPTRLRILCFMFEEKEACVGGIAKALDMSIASISHHLQIMRDNGLFDTERQGTRVCYKLSKSDFLTHVKDFVCECDNKK